MPIAYHVYNWHHIPFNVEYPHFLPAKPEFTENIKKLKDGGIYVMPYINAVSWDTEDIEGGHEINFKNCGKTAVFVVTRPFPKLPQRLPNLSYLLP